MSDLYELPWDAPQVLDSGGAAFNVQHRRFGAKGDGTTDDTAAFMDALAASEVYRQPIYVPAGTYLVGDLVVPSHTRIRGAGFNVYRSESEFTPSTLQLLPGAHSILRIGRIEGDGSTGVGGTASVTDGSSPRGRGTDFHANDSGSNHLREQHRGYRSPPESSEGEDPAPGVVSRTRVRPSKSTGVRRFSPAAWNAKPESVDATHAITADPSPRSASTSLQIRSRVRVEYTPT
jgi:hypothetical protein